MLKKLVIIGPAHPYRGGIASFNERLAQEFQTQGWQVKIINLTLQYPSLFFPGKDQYHDGPAPNNLDIKRVISSVNPLTWYKAGKQIRDFNPDLVISKFWHPYLGPALGTVLRKSKTKTLVSLDNVYPHERNVGDHSLINYFIKSADYFVVMSESVRQDLQDFVGEEKISLSPHPIYDNYGEAVDREEAIEKLGLNSEYRYLLFFGFIRAYKGLDLLLDAFAECDYKKHKLKLIVAGEFYDDEQKYLDQIKALGLEERVILKTDFIPNESVKYYFSASDLITQTYHRATQSGISQIAIQFEKPLLLTDVGGLKEIIDDGTQGYVVPADKSAIAEKIDLFFAEQNLKIFSSNMKTLKQKYSWETYYKAIIDLAFPNENISH